MTRQRPVVVDQVERGRRRELAVGLVHDQQGPGGGAAIGHRGDQVGVGDEPGRVVGRTEEHHARALGQDAVDLVAFEGEVVAPLPRDDPGAGDPGQVAVHGIGRLEGRRGPSRSAVGQEHGLEDLVGAVGAEDPVEGRGVVVSQRRPQGDGLAVGVAVPGHVGQRRGQLVDPGGRRADRRFVGVQPHRDVELGRVVPGHEGQVAAGLDPGGGHGRSVRRAAIDAACTGRPSAVASVSTTGPRRARPLSSAVTTWICLRKSRTDRAPA